MEKALEKPTNEAKEFFFAVRLRDSLQTEMDEKKRSAKNATSLTEKLGLYKEYRAISDEYHAAYRAFLEKSWALEDALEF